MNPIRPTQFCDFIHPERQLLVAIFLAGGCHFDGKTGHKDVSCAQYRHEDNLGRLTRGDEERLRTRDMNPLWNADPCFANLLLSLNAREVSKLKARGQATRAATLREHSGTDGSQQEGFTSQVVVTE